MDYGIRINELIAAEMLQEKIQEHNLFVSTTTRKQRIKSLRYGWRLLSEIDDLKAICRGFRNLVNLKEKIDESGLPVKLGKYLVEFDTQFCFCHTFADNVSEICRCFVAYGFFKTHEITIVRINDDTVYEYIYDYKTKRINEICHNETVTDFVDFVKNHKGKNIPLK